MGKIIDLTGQRFGKLTVLRKTDERRNRQVVWECRCDCGNISYVVGGSLRNGHTQSCGCSWKESKNVIDETGNRYGNLTVIKRSELKGTSSRQALWDCKCDCGNTRTVVGVQLRNGSVTCCQNCALKQGVQKRAEMDINYVGPIKDRVGERFGKLVVVAPTEKRQNGKMIWECKCDCGNTCFVSSNSLITGNTSSCGCLANLSEGENEIEELLKKHSISYRKQYIFNDLPLLRFDFGILQNDKVVRLIEFDGEQHFKPIDFFGGESGFIATKERDIRKNEYAKSHNIPLVRIPFTRRYHVTLEDILGDEFLVPIL